MKIIKLDNRHTAKRYGFNYALRFDTYVKEAGKVEDFLRKIHGPAVFLRKYNGPWYGEFGSYSASWKRLYWINVRSEADITLIILSGVTNENNI